MKRIIRYYRRWRKWRYIYRAYQTEQTGRARSFPTCIFEEFRAFTRPTLPVREWAGLFLPTEEQVDQLVRCVEGGNPT